MRITANIIKVTMLAIISVGAIAEVTAQDIVYEKEDSIFIEDIIKKHPTNRYKTTGERIIALAKEFIGKDYVAGTLDEHNHEPLYISSTRLDCTTFVELVLAAAVCKENDFINICRTIEQIRYRNGIRNGYTSRLHYISWWITDPAKQDVVKEIVTRHHTATQRLNLNFMSKHPESYRHLKSNKQTTEKIAALEEEYHDINVRYIPKEKIEEVTEKEINNGDIIAIVTTIKGLDISHIGFAHWHNNELRMIHASSAQGKVINDTTSLGEYLTKRKSNPGIRVFRAF